MEVRLNYKTDSFEFSVNCSNAVIQKNLEQFIIDFQGKRITDWVKEFIKKIKEETNNDPFTIKIIGCDLYEMDFINELISEKNDIISIEFEQVFDDKEIQYKYKVIDDFLEYAEQSKYDIVKNALLPNIKNIKNLRSTKIEVPVIATMSSGKSTLLNALIGQDFLHEDTGATTATTCDIIVNNNLKDFYAKAILNDNEEHNSNKEISEFLKRWNANANENIDNTNNVKKYPDLKLEIEGPIPNLNTSNFNLNFIDTPGPNSSQHSHHKEKTFSYLKDNQNLPIVLYVLDPEKMDSNDDDFTLEEISKVFKNNNKNIDRIVFVYNKIDREDIEEKSIKDILNKVESFLERKGIKNAKIFPVSAQYAKFAQIEECLKRNQKSDLNSFRNKFRPEPAEGYLGYQLLEYAPLTNSQKEKLNENLKKNQVEEDLVYSGLAALKLYIEDYITNHHKKNQYKELGNISNKIYDEILISIENEKYNLEIDNEEKKKLKEKNIKKAEIEIKEKQISIENEITNLPISLRSFKNEERKIRKDSNEIQNKINKVEQPTPQIANSLINEINNLLSNSIISLETTFDANLRDLIHDRIKNLKKITSGYFTVENEDITVDLINAKFVNKISSINVNNLNDFKKTIKVAETRIEYKRDIFGFKSFFGINYGTKKVVYYKDQEIIELKRFYYSNVQPVLSKLEKHISDFKIKCTDEIKKIDNQFIDKSKIISEELISEALKNNLKLIKTDLNERNKKLQSINKFKDNIKKIYKQ